MCGIAGFVSLTPPDPAILAAQLQTIIHRGPDGAGAWHDERVALGMRRLAIIDVAGGDQPMFSRCGRFVLVFNGEIYNYRVLRRRLEAVGQRFDTASDTEVLLRAIEHWGLEQAVAELNGMFAFALWDRERAELQLVRDRLGVKPLYYAVIPGGMVFGSEIKALLAHPAVGRELSDQGLINLLTWGHAVGDATILASVRRLEPAERLTFGPSQRPERTRYWRLDLTPLPPQSPAEAAAELAWRLREAVRIQCISDVPLGAFLSGGLDSSILVAIMTSLGHGPVRTFSAGFAADGRFNELADARLVADHFATDHHELLIEPEELPPALEELVWHYDEPFADAAALPVMLLARFARRHVTVALSGEGSDEQWGGYRRYGFNRLAGALGLVPGGRALSRLGRHLFRVKALQRGLNALAIADPSARYASWLAISTRQQREALLGATSHAPSLHDPISRYAMLDPGPGVAHINRVGAIDLASWLPETYLEKMDKGTMAASLEARVPFLDHTLVEWVMRLSPALKVRGLTTKWLLRKAFGEQLPQRTVRKPKHGFAVPTEPWLRGPLLPWTQEVLLGERARGRGLFAPQPLERLITDHASGKRPNDQLLWTLLCLELWQRRYLDGDHP